MMLNGCTKLKTLALRLGITRQTLRKYCEWGVVPSAYKSKNGTWKIPALDMDALEKLVSRIQNEVARAQNGISPTCRRPNGIKSAVAERFKKLGVRTPFLSLSKTQREDAEIGVLACLYQCAKYQIKITDENIAQIRGFLLNRISKSFSLNKSLEELGQNTVLAKFKPEQSVAEMVKQLAEGKDIETARYTIAEALNLNRCLYSKGKKRAGTNKIWRIINNEKSVRWKNELDGEEHYADFVEAYTIAGPKDAFEDNQTGFAVTDDRFVPEKDYSETSYYRKTERIDKKSAQEGVFKALANHTGTTEIPKKLRAYILK